MKIVLDVNVWVSGLLWRGVPKQILDLAQDGIVTIFVSEPILSELEEVLSREKFQSRMRSIGITTEDLMTSASQLSENCIPTLVNVPQLRDPDDAVILGTAIAAKATIIISGDLDLVVLEEFLGIPILTPTNFLTSFLG
jgi:uncharacterized protein